MKRHTQHPPFFASLNREVQRKLKNKPKKKKSQNTNISRRRIRLSSENSVDETTLPLGESRLELLLIRLAQHSRRRRVLQKGEGFPATRNETERGGRKRGGREEGNRKRPRRSRLWFRNSVAQKSVQCASDACTLWYIATSRCHPREATSRLNISVCTRPLIVSAIRADGLETEIDGFRANKSSRILRYSDLSISSPFPSVHRVSRELAKRRDECVLRLTMLLKLGRRKRNWTACFEKMDFYEHVRFV